MSRNENHFNKEVVFEEKAKIILDYLRSDLRYNRELIPRPFMIEFTGSPSSGKTTTITELDKFLRRQGFRVLRPQEGAEVIRHIERNTPVYNIRTGLYALTMLIDQSYGNNYDVMIFDRCIFDAYCWMMYWSEKNKLNPQEKWIVQSFFTSRFWSENIDAAYFMVCDPKMAMDRELKIALSSKLGETTNPTTIETLVKRYREAHKTLSLSHNQIRLIDTTNMDEQEMVENIATDVLNTLEAKSKSLS